MVRYLVERDDGEHLVTMSSFETDSQEARDLAVAYAVEWFPAREEMVTFGSDRHMYTGTYRTFLLVEVGEKQRLKAVPA